MDELNWYTIAARATWSLLRGGPNLHKMRKARCYSDSTIVYEFLSCFICFVIVARFPQLYRCYQIPLVNWFYMSVDLHDPFMHSQNFMYICMLPYSAFISLFPKSFQLMGHLNMSCFKFCAWLSYLTLRGLHLNFTRC